MSGPSLSAKISLRGVIAYYNAGVPIARESFRALKYEPPVPPKTSPWHDRDWLETLMKGLHFEQVEVQELETPFEVPKEKLSFFGTALAENPFFKKMGSGLSESQKKEWPIALMEAMKTLHGEKDIYSFSNVALIVSGRKQWHGNLFLAGFDTFFCSLLIRLPEIYSFHSGKHPISVATWILKYMVVSISDIWNRIGLTASISQFPDLSMKHSTFALQRVIVILLEHFPIAKSTRTVLVTMYKCVVLLYPHFMPGRSTSGCAWRWQPAVPSELFYELMPHRVHALSDGDVIGSGHLRCVVIF